MLETPKAEAKCPFASDRNDSKSAAIAAERAPDIGWSDMLMSYELRNAVVVCDRATEDTIGQP